MKKFICFIMVFVFTFGFSACGGSSEEETTTTTTTRPAAMEATIGTIYNDMTANFVKAQNTYAGKVYKFTATVTDIYETYIFSTLSDDSGTITNITVSFLNSEDIMEFSVGDTIKVEGYLEFTNDIAGLGFDIKDAVLVK